MCICTCDKSKKYCNIFQGLKEYSLFSKASGSFDCDILTDLQSNPNTQKLFVFTLYNKCLLLRALKVLTSNSSNHI